MQKGRWIDKHLPCVTIVNLCHSLFNPFLSREYFLMKTRFVLAIVLVVSGSLVRKRGRHRADLRRQSA